MLGHGGAHDRARPGHDVEGAGRQACFREQLGEEERGQRRDRRGLQHDRVAEREGRGDLPHGLQEREVPGRDRADDADRLPQSQEHRVRAAGIRVAVELVCRFAEVGEAVGRGRHVDLRRFEDRFSVVQRFGAAEIFRPRKQELRGLQQDPAPLPRFHVRPGARLEGRARGGHCAVEVLFPGFGDFRESLAGGGVDGGEAFAGGGRDERAVDEEICLEVKGRRRFCHALSLRKNRFIGSFIHRFIAHGP